MNEKIEEIAEITGICILNLVTMADVLNKLGMDEDAKQISEMALEVCGHGRGSYHFLKDKYSSEETE